MRPVDGLPAPRSARWAPLLLPLVVVLVFGRVINARFTQLDDTATVVDNGRFNPPTWSGIGYYWSHTDPDIYAPITYTVWGLLAKATYVPTPDEQGSHVDARVYHGVNVLLHSAAALCVYGILLQLMENRWAAIAGAGLFALHPLQVGGVAWVTGTRDVLAGLLSLLALLFYLRAARAEPGQRGLGLAGALVAFVAAMLTKPSAVSMPIVAAIIDRLLLDRPWRTILPGVGVAVALAVPVIVVNRLAQVAAHASAISMAFRFFIPGDALAFYLYKAFVPIHLAIQYPLRPPVMVHERWAYLGWLVPLGVAAILWRARRRWLWAGALVFAAGPLPVLGFLPFDWQWNTIVADHYVYVAMVGPAIVLAFALARCRKPTGWIVAAIYLVALGVLSFRQTGFWHDTTTLARHTLAVNPRSYIAHSLLAGESLATDPQRAIDEYRAAFDIDPTFAKAAGSLKHLLDLQGRHDEALDVMVRGVAANEALPPGQQFDASESYRKLAVTFEARGQFRLAAEYYRKLMIARPGDASAAEGLARVEREAALAEPVRH